MAQTARGRRWLRPTVDAAMTVVLLLQMVPGKTGNVVHEALGIAFVALFAAHHALNRGWSARLGRRHTLCSRCLLASDALLTVSVMGTAVAGLMMSRSVAPMLAVPALAHVVWPLHGTLAYVGFMACAFHVGLHLRVVSGYTGRKGRANTSWPILVIAVAAGLWAFIRLQVAGKLLGQPSFPDAMTPAVVQLLLHLALCLPFLVLGAMVDAMAQGGKDYGNEE